MLDKTLQKCHEVSRIDASDQVEPAFAFWWFFKVKMLVTVLRC